MKDIYIFVPMEDKDFVEILNQYEINGIKLNIHNVFQCADIIKFHSYKALVCYVTGHGVSEGISLGRKKAIIRPADFVKKILEVNSLDMLFRCLQVC